MSAKINLAKELLVLATDELHQSDIPVTLETQHAVLTEWQETYEEVPPRNRAERLMYDAIEKSLEFLAQRIRQNHTHVTR